MAEFSQRRDMVGVRMHYPDAVSETHAKHTIPSLNARDWYRPPEWRHRGSCQHAKIHTAITIWTMAHAKSSTLDVHIWYLHFLCICMCFIFCMYVLYVQTHMHSDRQFYSKYAKWTSLKFYLHKQNSDYKIWNLITQKKKNMLIQVKVLCHIGILSHSGFKHGSLHMIYYLCFLSCVRIKQQCEM